MNVVPDQQHTVVPIAPHLRDGLAGKRIIVMVATFELGGAERQALLMARLLKETCGAHVEMWGFSGPGRLSDLCDQYGIPHSSRLSRYPYRRRYISRVLRLIGITFALRRAHPDILLPYLLDPNRVCGMTWPMTGAKLCVWNQRNEGYGLEEAGKYSRCAARRTPLLIANSTRGAQFLVECLGVEAHRVHVVHNGIELAPPKRSRAEWRERLMVDAQTLLVCKVATLSKYKDHQTLLRAWRLVIDACAREGRTAVLALAGRFEAGHQALIDLVDDLGLNASVRLLGGVRDVTGLLHASDLAVFSSVSEGLPNGVLESMAVGLAVAGTDIPGIREAVGPEGAPYLAPVGNAEALADCILLLARDAPQRAALGQLNRERIAREFSPQQLCERTVSLILSTLDQRGKAGGER